MKEYTVTVFDLGIDMRGREVDQHVCVESLRRGRDPDGGRLLHNWQRRECRHQDHQPAQQVGR